MEATMSCCEWRCDGWWQWERGKIRRKWEQRGVAMFFLKKFLHSFFSHLSFSFSLSPCKQISLSLFSLTPSFSSFFLFLKTFPSFLLARVSLICTYFSLLIFSNLPSSPPFFFLFFSSLSLNFFGRGQNFMFIFIHLSLHDYYCFTQQFF